MVYNKTEKLIFIEANTKELLDETRKIFREYQESIDTDLCFQKFEEELKELPGKYSKPKGRLYLAYEGDEIAGCVALRPLHYNNRHCEAEIIGFDSEYPQKQSCTHMQNACEMKRLYVKPEFRGKGYGRVLAEKIIQDAKEIGYEKMFLDTLDTMKEAVKLYTSLGFKNAPEYCYNPIEGAIFMYLDL